jgi:hypothetical protein
LNEATVQKLQGAILSLKSTLETLEQSIWLLHDASCELVGEDAPAVAPAVQVKDLPGTGDSSSMRQALEKLSKEVKSN